MEFNSTHFKKNYPLRNLVTFKLGGPAEFFYEAQSTESMKAAIDYARQNSIAYFVLGGGSNLVVSDEGFGGLVIHNRCREISYIDHETRQINLSSGFDLEMLVELAHTLSFSGAECFTGIPGSIGGAIYGNAGAYGRSIADTLIDARILLPDGTIETVPNSFFRFDYRTSLLKKEQIIVLSARFQLNEGDQGTIKAQMDDILTQRKGKHPPYEVGCAGSFFKNLPPLPGESRRRAAGAVLEQAGAKGMSVGGASVFQQHANFIINQGNATAADVKKLARLLKEKVMSQFGIELSEEVLYVGR